MDGNKDEALKCLEIVKSAIESGDRNRAHKFLNKAHRLDPSIQIQIEDLLNKIQESPNESKSTQTDKSSTNGPRKRGVPLPATTSSVSYTDEQELIVNEIKRKKDYYDILGIQKSCIVEDVRKAYRKLSLKVHPDKNHAPRADEAFKKVSKAFQCLSDDENRRRYDVSGSDDDPVLVERRRRGDGMQGFNGFYAGDVDAYEIFRNFFYGGMHPAATAQFRGFGFGPGMGMGVRTGANCGSQGFSIKLIQLLPVLICLMEIL